MSLISYNCLEPVETVHRMIIAAGSIGRSYIKMNVADFTRMALGHLQWREALSSQRLEPSTKLAAKAGRVLFPRVPFWRPPFDDLHAQG